MDNSSFATQQARTSASTGEAAGALRHAEKHHKGQGMGNNFLDLLFAHIDMEAGLGLPGLKLGQNVKANAPTDITDITVETDADTSVTTDVSDRLTSIFDTLLHGTPASGAEVANALTVKSDGTLEVSGKDGAKAAPALIATGLSPEKLTAILQKLAVRLKALKDSETQTPDTNVAVAATVQIVPPPQQQRATFFGGPVHGARGFQAVMSANAHAAAAASAGAAANGAGKGTGIKIDSGAKSDAEMDALASKLNGLMVGAGDSMGDEAPGGGLPDQGKGAGGFHQILKVLEHVQGQNGLNAGAGAAAAAGAKPAQAETGAGVNAGVVATPFGPLSAGTAGSLLDASGAWKDIYPDSLTVAATSGASHQMSLSGPVQYTSLVTHASSAGSTHPATQMVASALVKAASNGEDRDFTIRLDPAELGKVQIDMSFKNKDSLKTHLVVEKPETYMMLQRDAHVLEKALSDLGMNVASGSLSFELSQGGSQFNGNGSGNNGQAGGKNSQDGGADTEIATETTMNWYVDEQSGRTRYSLLA